ncbi:unnamed protein product [Adineta steineri]|uniref:Uncharacterized protein n=1 Tax=Adineta steineri TaxID=433720 RepID=A0A813M999_9BILA|nr:unnamed protein product [Adineta steineri]
MPFFIPLIIGLGAMSVPLGYFFHFDSTPPSPSCNMVIPKNRDFNKYYGIIDMPNHFTPRQAEECHSTIIYEPALPPMILNSAHSASSFMTLAEYGTGKTLLRCEYFRSLSSNDYLKLTILDKDVTQYLDRFVREMDVNKMQCQTKNCPVDWSENEFTQLLLSSLVTNFIDTGKGTTRLEKFVNWFLGKGQSSQYKVDGEHLQKYKNHNPQLFKHLENDLNKFSILDKNPDRLSLLVVILEGEGFQNRASAKHLYGEHFRDLIQFSSFIKNYFKKTPVFVIDGIDQDVHFVRNGINRASFESFCRSSVSPSVLSMVMANHFHLSLFYPKINDANIEDFVSRKDKFRTHTINWNTNFLISYADYALQDMNKNAKETRCKELTDFKTLVNYSNKKIAEIIDKIPTPRVLNFFMEALMEEMNGDALNARKPFQATFENVRSAYKQALKSFETKTN